MGAPTDWAEVERVDWLTVDELRTAVATGQVVDGLSLTALLWLLAFGPAR